MKKSKQSAEYARIYAEAVIAGNVAGEQATVDAMVVVERENPMDDSSPVMKKWIVDSGVCGFAWVVIRPGTSSFARWLVKESKAGKHYYGGIEIWIGGFGQSMTRKEAAADAMARVFRSYGIPAYVGSRMD